jgi:hypothetical protein
MKIQIISIISIVLFFSCKPSTPLQESNYTVNVKAEGVYNGLRGYLVKLDRVNSRVLTDTAIVYNGAFTFKGKSKRTSPFCS